MKTVYPPVYINNELPLFVHELRAQLYPSLLNLLDEQPEEYKERNVLDTVLTAREQYTRELIIDIAGRVLWYFDDGAQGQYSPQEFIDILQRSLVGLTNSRKDMFELPEEMKRAGLDFYIEVLKLLKTLFNVALKVPLGYPIEWSYEQSPRITKEQITRMRVYDALNEMHFSEISSYFAHVGHARDVSTGRSMLPRPSIIHSGYLLAHHGMGDSGKCYHKSMHEFSRLDGFTKETFNKHFGTCRRSSDPPTTRIPIFLDNSAFELGESVTVDTLLPWFQEMRLQGVIDPDKPFEYVIILPDVLGDFHQTVENSKSFIREFNRTRKEQARQGQDPFEGANYSFMFVLQDRKPEEGEKGASCDKVTHERVSNFIQYVWSNLSEFVSDPDHPRLWVGFPMMRYGDDNQMQFDMKGAVLRAQTINALGKWMGKESPGALDSGMITGHILGCVSPAEYRYLDENGKGMASSLDTSFPFSVGRHEALTKPFGESSNDLLDRPWKVGKKLSGKDSKPFSMSLPTTKPANDEDKTHIIRHVWYQIESLNRFFKTLAINQRMFEEWVGEVWSE